MKAAYTAHELIALYCRRAAQEWQAALDCRAETLPARALEHMIRRKLLLELARELEQEESR